MARPSWAVRSTSPGHLSLSGRQLLVNPRRQRVARRSAWEGSNDQDAEAGDKRGKGDFLLLISVRQSPRGSTGQPRNKAGMTKREVEFDLRLGLRSRGLIGVDDEPRDGADRRIPRALAGRG